MTPSPLCGCHTWKPHKLAAAGSCHAATNGNAAAAVAVAIGGAAAQIFTIISSQFLARKAAERDKEEFISGGQIP